MTTESLQVDAADLGRPPSRAATWLRRHPVVVDVVVVLAAGVPHLLVLLLGAGATAWWGYLLLAVAVGALLVRRQRPLTVLIVIAVACALSELTQPGLATPTLSFAFALYTVASRETMTRTLVGYGAAVAVTVLATIPESLLGIRPDQVSLTDPVSLLALVAGFLVKSRRDHTRWLTETVNQRIENAALTERTRIAAEMHDVVAHSLTVIVTLANGATSAAQKHPERSRAAVEQIAAVGRDALGDMHRTLALLRDADAGLDANLHRSGDNLPTLEELAEGFRAAGLPVTLTRTGPALPDDAALRQAVYRIVQESLTNTLRHAHGPTGATVAIDHGGGAVVLTITNDGGPVTRPGPPGHGLVGIRQRAAAHGGEAEAGPRPGGGWRTRVVLGTGGTRDEGDRTEGGDRDDSAEGGDRGDG
ncbi:sensor histidine kinase [Promicromonospora panici]|uniref:sensor histidine kinase n=1 Tax=Promicromonospora panici TaxID=2219658 RepID=UPI0013ED20FE|nr:histidine kinase [Promicromonospora panici]